MLSKNKNDPDDNFKFAPANGISPLYFGYVLKCKPFPIDIDSGDWYRSSHQIDTHIYWNSGTYNGGAAFTNLEGNTCNEKFDINVLPKSNSQVITGFYQTKAATIEGDAVGFSLSLGVPNNEISKIEWVWDDGTSDSYSFPDLPEAINPWHTYKSAGIFNGSITVSRKNNVPDTRKFSVVVAENPANHKDIAFIIKTSKFPTTKGKPVIFSLNIVGSLNGVDVKDVIWNIGNESFHHIDKDALAPLSYTFQKQGVYKVDCNVGLYYQSYSKKRYQLAVPVIEVVND